MVGAGLTAPGPSSLHGDDAFTPLTAVPRATEAVSAVCPAFRRLLPPHPLSKQEQTGSGVSGNGSSAACLGTALGQVSLFSMTWELSSQNYLQAVLSISLLRESVQRQHTVGTCFVHVANLNIIYKISMGSSLIIRPQECFYFYYNQHFKNYFWI